MTRIAGILHEDKYTLRNVSDKSCGETQNIHFTFNIYIYIYIYLENRAFMK
jgi:hypothetical protein